MNYFFRPQQIHIVNKILSYAASYAQMYTADSEFVLPLRELFPTSRKKSVYNILKIMENRRWFTRSKKGKQYVYKFRWEIINTEVSAQHKQPRLLIQGGRLGHGTTLHPYLKRIGQCN